MMTIIGLSLACSPTTVLWGVIAVIVDALNRQISPWSFAHVSKEVLKLLPAFANLDSSSAVSVEVLNLRIVTARSHSPPDSKFRSVSSAMSPQTVSADLAMQASAGAGVPASQTVADNDLLYAACATTQPSDFSADFPHPPQNGQSAECFARQINQLHMDILDYCRRGVNLS